MKFPMAASLAVAVGTLATIGCEAPMDKPNAAPAGLNPSPGAEKPAANASAPTPAVEGPQATKPADSPTAPATDSKKEETPK